MGRGSLVGRRAMSGQVKKTDRENGGKCVFRGQKEWRGQKEMVNGEVMDV